MELIRDLITGESGMIFSTCLLFTGFSDIILTAFIFTSQLRQIERKRELVSQTKQKAEIDKKIRRLQISMHAAYTIGLALTFLGLYALFANLINE